MASVEQLVARALMVGGLVGIALLLLGSGLYAAHGGFDQDPLHLTRPSGAAPPGVFTSVRQVVNGIRTRPVDPLAVTALGLVVLMGTPVLAVALAIPAFLRAGDRQYAAIAAFVLTLLLVSLTLAGGIH
ncbi:MAG TPA: DUF1634 domain-containing protein [Methylomirabilota bacterium]|nr:DUF1634 domain-containing protein [Methylomirabilota bacterium]